MSTYESKQHDLVEVAHAGLYPFIFIYKVLSAFLRVLAFLIILCSWFLFNNAGWIVGIGNHGILQRQEMVKDWTYVVDNSPAGAPDHTRQTFETDFRVRRPKPADRPYEYYDWAAAPPTGPQVAYLDPLMVTGEQPGVEWPELCESKGSTAKRAHYTYELGPWEIRNRDSIIRKSTYMSLAYETAQIMTSMMRHSFAGYKHGQIPVFTQRTEYRLCSTNYTHFYRDVVDASGITLSHAPVIQLQVIFGGIAGVCLKDECSVGEDDLDYHVTMYADLFAATPPLSRHQQHAVDVMNSLSSDAFWLQAAAENGIHDDTAVRVMASDARMVRDQIIAFAESERIAETR